MLTQPPTPAAPSASARRASIAAPLKVTSTTVEGRNASAPRK